MHTALSGNFLLVTYQTACNSITLNSAVVLAHSASIQRTLSQSLVVKMYAEEMQARTCWHGLRVIVVCA